MSDVLQLNRRDRVVGRAHRASAPWLAGFVEEFAANESVPRERFALERARARPAIEFDREHLRQVLWNLLRNAVRHARAEPRSVRLGARRLRRPRRAER